MENIITPILNNIGTEDPIGIRIGMDYGLHDDIVWEIMVHIMHLK